MIAGMCRPRLAAIVPSAIGLAVAARAAAAPVETTTQPYPGVTHVAWVDAATQQRGHWVVVDLSNDALTLRVNREDTRGRTTSQVARDHGAQLAVNGDLFAAAGFVPDGLAVGDGMAWSTAQDDEREAVFRFGKVVSGTDALIIPPESIVAPADLPPYVTGALGGRPLLVRAGQIPSSFDCADPGPQACVRAPRTALGLSADRRTLTIAVVDGWQAGALGVTAAELAALLVGRGVRDAVMLDGGGASTLYIANEGVNGLVNRPSDGVERPVADHLLITSATPVTRTLVGKVRERDIFTGTPLAGVLITLDDGRTMVTDTNDTGYSFVVPIRYVCVDATKAGYDPVHQCRQMDPNMSPNFNSIAMFPAGTGPDAGVDAAVDAPPPPGDAATDAARDGGSGADASGDPGGAGGCCQAGTDGAPVAGLGAIVVFGILRRSRRRR